MASTPAPIEGSYRTPSFEKATVADAMHPGVVSCAPDASLRTVARIMVQHHIHSVVVAGLDDATPGRDWTVVTDTDVLRASGSDLDTEEARAVAGTEVPVIGADEPLTSAAELMASHRVTHLIVAEGERAVGVLSSLDIAGILAWGRA